MITDLHAHVIVPEILRNAAPDEDWRPVVRREGGDQVVEMGGKAIRAAIEEFVDVEAIVAHQEQAGIERTVLCPWVPLLFYDAEPEEGLRRCRIQNEALAALAGDRVGALGAVPLQDPELAAAELRAVMATGSLHGVEVAASVGGTYLGDDRFEPFWAAAEETGALVFIHPTTRGFDAPGSAQAAGSAGGAASVFSEHYLWNAVGNPLETTITAAHMTLAGVMERHPGLRALLAHAGGAIVALRGRLRHAHSFQAQARSRLAETPERSLRRFLFDTITHDPRLLADLVEYAGAEQVVLGTDYPFDMGDLRPLETLRAAGLSDEDEKAIAGGNAARLLEPRKEELHS